MMQPAPVIRAINIDIAASIWQEAYRQAVNMGLQPPAAGRAAAMVLCETQLNYTLHTVRDAFIATGEHPAAAGYMESVLETRPDMDDPTPMEVWVGNLLGGFLDI